MSKSYEGYEIHFIPGNPPHYEVRKEGKRVFTCDIGENPEVEIEKYIEENPDQEEYHPPEWYIYRVSRYDPDRTDTRMYLVASGVFTFRYGIEHRLRKLFYTEQEARAYLNRYKSRFSRDNYYIYDVDKY